MVELFVRHPSGDSEWTENAAAVCRSFANHVREALCDAEEYGPVDLRDLQTVLKSAIDDVILHEMVCRRLGPDTDPGDIGGLPEVVEEASEQSDEWLARDSYRTTEKKRVWLHNKWQDF